MEANQLEDYDTIYQDAGKVLFYFILFFNFLKRFKSNSF